MSGIPRSEITIVIDTGKRRQTVNVPTAEDVEVETIMSDPPAFYDPRATLRAVPEVESIRLSFKPIGSYTIKEEDLP